MEGTSGNVSTVEPSGLWRRETYLDGLPWTEFYNGGGCWIYADQAPELAEELKRVGHDLRFGSFIYRLKCKGIKLFIQRFLARRKRNP